MGTKRAKSPLSLAFVLGLKKESSRGNVSGVLGRVSRPSLSALAIENIASMLCKEDGLVGVAGCFYRTQKGVESKQAAAPRASPLVIRSISSRRVLGTGAL